jgi:hypothetical protein
VLCGLRKIGWILRARHLGVGHSGGEPDLGGGGGKVTDYRGSELDLEGREIVASNGELHLAMTRLTGEDGQR